MDKRKWPGEDGIFSPCVSQGAEGGQNLYQIIFTIGDTEVTQTFLSLYHCLIGETGQNSEPQW